MSELEPINPFRSADAERYEKIATMGEVMLRDLYEMTLTWGGRYVQRDDIYILNPEDFGIKSEIFVEAKADPKDLRLIVKNGEDSILHLAVPPYDEGNIVSFVLGERQIVEETASGISYPKTLPQMLVIYDTDLSLEEIFSFTAEMMVAGNNKGLVEEGGERKKNPDRKYFVQKKLKVEEVFKDEGAYITILPDIDISETLEQFDNPNELSIIENPYTGTPSVITHKRWVDYHEMKFKVANDVFLEMGINPIELAAASAFEIDTFLPLIEKAREEIETRTKDEWAKRKKS